MTNPTKPLDIEARELLAKHYNSEGTSFELQMTLNPLPTKCALAAISELLTRLRDVEKDKYIRFTDTMNQLELDNAMMAQRLKAGELEYMRCQAEKLSASQALLEECREVLGPFARHAKCYDPDEGDGNNLAWDLGNVVSIGDLRRAASLIEKLEGMG